VSTPRNAVTKTASGPAVAPSFLTDEDEAKIAARKTPPKKYADPSRTVLTAEYKVWYQANRRTRFPTEEEAGHDFLLNEPGFPGVRVDVLANHSVYFPEQHDKDLGDGAWVLVVDPPVTVQWSEFKVPILSMWWARPHVLNTGPVGGRLPYQGIIQTPAGDLHLWPHEYVVVNDPAGLVGCEGVEIHTLGGEPLLDPDQVFYLQQRGIPMHDVVAMLWSQMETGDYGYVTFPPDAVDVYAGVNTRAMGQVRERYEAGEYAVAGR
jgi:hypothetical protein